MMMRLGALHFLNEWAKMFQVAHSNLWFLAGAFTHYFGLLKKQNTFINYTTPANKA